VAYKGDTKPRITGSLTTEPIKVNQSIIATMNYIYRYLKCKTKLSQGTETKVTWNMKKEKEDGGSFFFMAS
jgi:hypothetical protein